MYKYVVIVQSAATIRTFELYAEIVEETARWTAFRTKGTLMAMFYNNHIVGYYRADCTEEPPKH